MGKGRQLSGALTTACCRAAQAFQPMARPLQQTANAALGWAAPQQRPRPQTSSHPRQCRQSLSTRGPHDAAPLPPAPPPPRRAASAAAFSSSISLTTASTCQRVALRVSSSRSLADAHPCLEARPNLSARRACSSLHAQEAIHMIQTLWVTSYWPAHLLVAEQLEPRAALHDSHLAHA